MAAHPRGLHSSFVEEYGAQARGGIVRGGSSAWVAGGCELELLDVRTGKRQAYWSFDRLPTAPGQCPVLTVSEVNLGGTVHLVAGVVTDTGGMLVVLDPVTSRVNFTVSLPHAPTAITSLGRQLDEAPYPSVEDWQHAIVIGTRGCHVLVMDMSHPSALEEHLRGVEIPAGSAAPPGSRPYFDLMSGFHDRGRFEHRLVTAAPGNGKFFATETINVTALRLFPRLGCVAVGFSFGGVQLFSLRNRSQILFIDAPDMGAPATGLAHLELEDDDHSHVLVAHSTAPASLASAPYAAFVRLFIFETPDPDDEPGPMRASGVTLPLQHQGPSSLRARIVRCDAVAVGGKANADNGGPRRPPRSCAVLTWENWATDSSPDKAGNAFVTVFDLEGYKDLAADTAPLTRYFLGVYRFSGEGRHTPLLDACVDPRSVVTAPHRAIDDTFSESGSEEAHCGVCDGAGGSLTRCDGICGRHYHRECSQLSRPEGSAGWECEYCRSGACAQRWSLKAVSITGRSYVETQFLSGVETILSGMAHEGPSALGSSDSVAAWHLRCYEAGLISRARGGAATDKREQLLSLALERNLSALICSYVSAVSDFPDAARIVLRWASRYHKETEQHLQSVYATLFSSAPGNVAKKVKELEVRLVRLTALLGVFLALRSLAAPGDDERTAESGRAALERKESAVLLVSQHLEMVLWAIQHHLIGSGGKPFPYPAARLQQEYQRRRQERAQLANANAWQVQDMQGARTTLEDADTLFVDLLTDQISAEEPEFPPASVKALFDIFLRGGAESYRQKRALVFYILLDLEAVGATKAELQLHLEFARRFLLSQHDVSLFIGLWCLDANTKLDVACQCLCEVGVTVPWPARVFRALADSGVPSLALRFFERAHPPLETVEDMAVYIRVLVANDSIELGFHAQRQLSRTTVGFDRVVLETLLFHFFHACEVAVKVAQLLRLPWDSAEEACLVRWLQRGRNAASQDVLVVHYLNTQRFAEAQALHRKLSADPRCNREAREAREALLANYGLLMPEVQRHLASGPVVDSRPDAWARADGMDGMLPLSAARFMRKPNAAAPPVIEPESIMPALAHHTAAAVAAMSPMVRSAAPFGGGGGFQVSPNGPRLASSGLVMFSTPTSARRRRGGKEGETPAGDAAAAAHARGNDDVVAMEEETSPISRLNDRDVAGLFSVKTGGTSPVRKLVLGGQSPFAPRSPRLGSVLMPTALPTTPLDSRPPARPPSTENDEDDFTARPAVPSALAHKDKKRRVAFDDVAPAGESFRAGFADYEAADPVQQRNTAPARVATPGRRGISFSGDAAGTATSATARANARAGNESPPRQTPAPAKSGSPKRGDVRGGVRFDGPPQHSPSRMSFHDAAAAAVGDANTTIPVAVATARDAREARVDVVDVVDVEEDKPTAKPVAVVAAFASSTNTFASSAHTRTVTSSSSTVSVASTPVPAKEPQRTVFDMSEDEAVKPEEDGEEEGVCDMEADGATAENHVAATAEDDETNEAATTVRRTRARGIPRRERRPSSEGLENPMVLSPVRLPWEKSPPQQQGFAAGDVIVLDDDESEKGRESTRAEPTRTSPSVSSSAAVAEGEDDVSVARADDVSAMDNESQACDEVSIPDAPEVRAVEEDGESVASSARGRARRSAAPAGPPRRSQRIAHKEEEPPAESTKKKAPRAAPTAPKAKRTPAVSARKSKR